ncbi:hypothetical protein [Marinobacter sp. C2H3]|uniref:hypothetical protein n=1 Tax=Marinobacter sp. C2H3 TaxID=3119003 RepID=UPI00300E8B73
MRLILSLSLAAVTAALLSGCFGGSGNGDALATSKDFTTFVKQEINNTRDDRESVNINRLDFSFNDQTNPQAFDDVLAN